MSWGLPPGQGSVCSKRGRGDAWQYPWRVRGCEAPAFGRTMPLRCVNTRVSVGERRGWRGGGEGGVLALFSKTGLHLSWGGGGISIILFSRDG